MIKINTPPTSFFYKIDMIFLILGLSFLFWPFDIQGISSQIIAIVIISMATIRLHSIILNRKVRKEALFLLPLIPILIIGMYEKNIAENNQYYIFYVYILKIPFFYILTSYIMKYLIENGFFSPLSIISLSAIPFLLFIALQTVSPEIDKLFEHLSYPDTALSFRENKNGGHPWRNLGWNGFLFASDGVSLSFVAIFSLVARYNISGIKNNILFFIEILCLVIAFLAGRSALPVILVYIFLSTFVFNKKSWLIVLPIYIGITFIAYTIFSLFKGFDTVLFWFLEPILTSINAGTLRSNSTSETNETYTNFFTDTNYIDLIFGLGFYNKSNTMYEQIGLVGSDSGYIRLISMNGYIGVFFLISTYFLFVIKAMISYSKSKENRNLIFLLCFYFTFSLVFFYKSEWLYQNFFIFSFFFLYHNIARQDKR